ncbi:hypothetical protein [Photorhabdus sp. RW14-46]|nr:hypothetical protein [Photorhabdus sp. RW14-46]
MTGVSEYSQQRGNLKDNGYISIIFSQPMLPTLITLHFYQPILTPY